MTQLESQGTTHRPAILELLSELEKRDEKSHGAARPAPADDPRGFKVLNGTGHDVGKITDLYVDPHSRRPEFAMLQLGNNPLGIGDRHVLVAFDDIDIVAEREARVKVAV